MPIPTLDDLLHEACARGLTCLSLYPVPSDDRKTTYWHATANPSTAHKIVAATTTDPVTALHEVLLLMPKAPLRKGKAEPVGTVDTPDMIGHTHVGALAAPVTAAVISGPRSDGFDSASLVGAEPWRLK